LLVIFFFNHGARPELDSTLAFCEAWRLAKSTLPIGFSGVRLGFSGIWLVSFGWCFVYAVLTLGSIDASNCTRLFYVFLIPRHVLERL
jgi:hypothetical protein